MFNLFKKKEESVKVIDKIWMSEKAKWNGILELWKKDPDIVIIAWFNSTINHLETLFAKETTSPVSFHLAREIHSSMIKGKQVIFAEHHPLRAREQEQFRQWQLQQAVVYSAMDEPLFQQFGGEKIIQLMKQLGMPEEGVIEHKMISHSIENAQQKIEKKVSNEHTASSQQEWMEKNFRG
ncbi:MAG: hypothetical protein WDO16_05210 [Bacteroidota bacterium]